MAAGSIRRLEADRVGAPLLERHGPGSARPAGSYPLGHTDHELSRLALQSGFYGEATVDVLRRAGIGTGMRVLDVGCGAGDVALSIARMVGPSGAVLGVDRSQRAIEVARQRAETAACDWLRFQAADLSTFGTRERSDAVTGRFILGYMPEPAKLLRRLPRFLRPGGAIAFVEMDVSSADVVPELALYNQCRRWVLAAYRHAGVEPDMGSRLRAVFEEAGLRASTVDACLTAEGPDTPVYAYIAETIRSLLPTILALDLATAAEVDIETLADRLRRKSADGQRRIIRPRLVGAWARSPS